MPSTRQSSLPLSDTKRPTRKAAIVKINYADDSPKKVAGMNVRKNLGDAWTVMAKAGKKPGGTPAKFTIGDKKTTLVKKIDPEIVTVYEGIDKVKPKGVTLPNQLPTSLRITKLDNSTKPNVAASKPGKPHEVWISQQKSVTPRQTALLASNQRNAGDTRQLRAVLPGVKIHKLDEGTPNSEIKMTVRKSGKENSSDQKTNNGDTLSFPSQPAPAPTLRSTPSKPQHTLRSVSTPVQKSNLSSPSLSRSSGRVVKKPFVINSQKKAIARTIQKLNQDQKKRIEERLGDIGSNLQKIKQEEQEAAKENGPELVVDRRPLKEVLSDKNWLDMFLLTEPTARYNPAKDTLYCATCKDMSEDMEDDGWVKGLPKGVEWLKYREHKLGDEHQRTSTKYFLQLFTAFQK